MCYQDADDTVLRTVCPDPADDARLDCNHDDYYNTNPAAGSYLAKEFNVADNLFLIKGADATPTASPSASPSASASPTPTTSTATTTSVVGTQSGRCVDMNLDDVTNGQQAQIWACNGARNQAWTYTSGKALMLHDNKCLDVYNQSTSPGAKAVIWDCNGGANQQWSFNSNGTLTGVQSGLCLDAAGQGTANGTKLLLWTCNGQTNQQWSRK
jgi:hypothetical protein